MPVSPLGSATTRAPRSATDAGAELPIPGRLWPLVALSVGLPPLFLLGLASVAWALPAVVFGAALIGRGNLRMPMGAGLLIALLVWILLSGAQLRSLPSLALFGYRWTLFASLAAVFIWVCTISRDQIPDAALVRVVGWTWPVLMVFGWLAIMFPYVSSPSAFLRLLPGGLAQHPYVVDIASLRFAETQGFLGYPVPRPAAPFAYANGWGSAVALTLPFFVLDWLVHGSPRRQRIGLAILAFGFVPVVVSLNRGLWACCGVAVGYVAVRRAVAGDLRTFMRLVVAGALVVTVALASPLGHLIDDRIEASSDSNDTRRDVAEAALSHALDSPLLGFGAPATDEREGPVAIGSHGLLWYLTFSHGFVAAGLFLAWLAGALRRGLKQSSPQGLWMTAVLLILVVQLPIYNALPHLAVAGVAAALIWRETAAGPSPPSRV